MADFGTAFDKIAEIVSGTSLDVAESLGMGTRLHHAKTAQESRASSKMAFSLTLRQLANEGVQSARLTRKRQAVAACDVFFPTTTDVHALHRVLGLVFEAVADRLQNPALWATGTTGITSITLAPGPQDTHVEAEVVDREGGTSLVFPIPFTFRSSA